MIALIKLPLLVLSLIGCAVSQSPQTCNPAAPAPYKGIAVIVFNATLPARNFTVDGNNFYDNVSAMNTRRTEYMMRYYDYVSLFWFH